MVCEKQDGGMMMVCMLHLRVMNGERDMVKCFFGVGVTRSLVQ